MENLLKKSNVRKEPEPTFVCNGCVETLDIKVKHDANLPAYDKCYGCGCEKWCCTYLI